jgi:hypothetical protein
VETRCHFLNINTFPIGHLTVIPTCIHCQRLSEGFSVQKSNKFNKCVHILDIFLMFFDTWKILVSVNVC